ncbi:cytochrome b [Salinisphaera sp.]|uniref:cytochrome b n=1 Tax=Salinisphaera sp. TaxID=1914330 RepID=UPI002D795726|nr:cytochrome b [Salinisphaera sp.]HET7314989.1 cytochrome b [Salinisphaera sp.]
MRDSRTHYGLISRCLHWLLLVLIVIQFTLVFIFTWFIPGQPTVIMLHKSFGLLILLFGLIFIAWRLTQPKPSLKDYPTWQRGLARLVHFVIYVAIIAQPVFGSLMVMSSGSSIPFFGLFSIPPFAALGRGAASVFGTLHAFTGWWIVLIALGIHLAGSLYHHFVSKDDVLRRMWRGRPGGS